MAVDLDKPKTLKGVALYLGAGAAMLAYSAKRAADGRPVWPGFRDGSGNPPSATTGALETVVLWPAAALWYATSPDAQTKPTAPSSSSAGSSSTP